MTDTPRVMIWRYTDHSLTVAHSDGSCWNAPDTMFTNVRHNGRWSSKLMRFAQSEYFSDGTPVAIYERDRV